MGILIKKLSEGCCEHLEKRDDKIYLDEYKKKNEQYASKASIDHLIECKDKYILIEEKSFILDYLRLAGKEIKEVFQPINGEIKDEFLDKLKNLNRDKKEKIGYKSAFDMILSFFDKIKDTMVLLYDDDKFKNEKIKDAKIVYLYCKPKGFFLQLKIFDIIFNKKFVKQKIKIVECSGFPKFLKENCS